MRTFAIFGAVRPNSKEWKAMIKTKMAVQATVTGTRYRWIRPMRISWISDPR